MQQTLLGVFKFGHLLYYEEVFIKEKKTYTKIKVIVSIYVSRILCFIYLFIFLTLWVLCKMLSILVEKMELLIEECKHNKRSHKVCDNA